MAVSGDSKKGILAANQSPSRLSQKVQRASCAAGSRTRKPGAPGAALPPAKAASSVASGTIAWRKIGTPVICPSPAAPEGDVPCRTARRPHLRADLRGGEGGGGGLGMPATTLHWIDYVVMLLDFAFVLGIAVPLKRGVRPGTAFSCSGRSIP